MRAIFWKEMADHFGRRRFIFLFALVVMGLLWATAVTLREVKIPGRINEEFLFLQIFTSSSGLVPPFLFFLSFFGPLAGIILGFDSINSERTQGTLSRVLSQPVFRDAVYNGKFLAGLMALTIVQVSMVITIVGMGMLLLGLPPNGEEVVRIIGFSVVGIVYVALWLAVAMTCSIFFRNVVTSAMASVGLWLFTTFFIVLIAGTVANFLVPVVETPADVVRHFNVDLWISRFSPSTLFSEATRTLLDPLSARGAQSIEFLSRISPERLQGLLMTPLSAAQSLFLIWPHIIVLVSLIAVFLGVSYTKFMREEVRS